MCSPFAPCRHRQVITALLFISFHLFVRDLFFLLWIIWVFFVFFLISKQMPEFDFQYVLPWYFSLAFFSHSECRLSFSSKGNINYIVFFFRVRRAQQNIHVFIQYTHIKFIKICFNGNTRTIMYSRMQAKVRGRKSRQRNRGRTPEDGEKLHVWI